MTDRSSWNMASIASKRPLPKPRAMHPTVVGQRLSAHAEAVRQDRCCLLGPHAHEPRTCIHGFHSCEKCAAPKADVFKREYMGKWSDQPPQPTPEQQYHPETLRIFEAVRGTSVRPIRCTSLPGFVIHADTRFAVGKVGISKTGPEKQVFCHPDELIKAIDACRVAREQELQTAAFNNSYAGKYQAEMNRLVAERRASEEYQRRYRDTMNGQAPLTRSEFQEALAKF